MPQAALLNDHYLKSMGWSSSGQAVNEMLLAIRYWQMQGHFGIAHVLELELLLEYPTCATTQGESFILKKTRFLESVHPLLQRLGHIVPEAIQGSQIFLPIQLVEVPAFAKHFAEYQLPDCLGRTIIHMLVDAGRLPKAFSVDWHTAYIDKSDLLSRTPFYLACRDNNEAMAEALGSKNIDVNVQTITGLLPVHAAAISGATSIISSMPNWRSTATNRYSVHVLDPLGRSPLFWAIISNQIDTAKTLIDSMPTISLHADDRGYTAAGIAVSKGHIDVFRLLIMRRIASDEPDGMGRSPI
jgi:hypothetical protein